MSELVEKAADLIRRADALLFTAGHLASPMGALAALSAIDALL